ncbi:MAG: cytochrome c4, partial [Hydrogenophaga sp.]
GAWQTGLRQAHAPDCMAQIAQRLAAPDIAAVAAWLSAQPLPADPHPAPATTEAQPLRCGSAGSRP